MKKLILVGCGLVHLSLLKRLVKKPLADTEIYLVSERDHFAHPGMLSGFLSGFYRADELYIPIKDLAEKAKVKFVFGQVQSIAEDFRSLTLASGETFEFDLASLNIGCVPNLASVPGAESFAHAVLPIDRFQRAVLDFCDSLRGRRKIRIAHVGADSVGLEAVLSLHRRLRVYGTDVEVVVVDTAAEILTDLQSDVKEKVIELLRARGAKIMLGQTLERIEEFALVFQDGTRLQADFISWSQGSRLHESAKNWDLSRTADGRIQINAHLQTSASRVFATGDAAVDPENPTAACGLHGFKQAFALHKNLRASLNGLKLKKFRVGKARWMFLADGEGRALVTRGKLHLPMASWIWNWRVKRDRAFLARFSQLLGLVKFNTPQLRTGLTNDLGHQVVGKVEGKGEATAAALAGRRTARAMANSGAAEAGGLVSHDAAQA